jgi:hypothetical protein
VARGSLGWEDDFDETTPRGFLDEDVTPVPVLNTSIGWSVKNSGIAEALLEDIGNLPSRS